MVREKVYFVVDCCIAEGIVVEHCCCTCSAFLIVPGPRGTREFETKQPRTRITRAEHNSYNKQHVEVAPKCLSYAGYMNAAATLASVNLCGQNSSSTR